MNNTQSNANSKKRSEPVLTPLLKWKKRLSSLDENKQKQIAIKYYGGHMLWKE